MRHVKLLLPQVIVAALCATFALFYFLFAFGFGDAGIQPPFQWRVIFAAIIGVIAITGLGFVTVLHRFPWLVPILAPVMIRLFMLRPSQLDLYGLALWLGAFTDLVFLVGAGIGEAVYRWRQHRVKAPFQSHS